MKVMIYGLLPHEGYRQPYTYDFNDSAPGRLRRRRPAAVITTAAVENGKIWQVSGTAELPVLRGRLRAYQLGRGRCFTSTKDADGNHVWTDKITN